MATYVLMTKLSPAVLGDPRGRRAVGKEPTKVEVAANAKKKR
jgi:hypothetical protein